MVRIGIDVGGTFTHLAVARSADGSLVFKERTPTTHSAPGGVAEGITRLALEALRRVPAESVDLLGFSTTQATNALLEGDVAAVTIAALDPGSNQLARKQLGETSLSLDQGLSIELRPVFQETGEDPADFARRVADANPECVAVSGAFDVEDTAEARRTLDALLELGVPACGGSDLSGLYGLKARTNTAAVNACILPKMAEVARWMEAALKEAGVEIPLFVMRSDGGLMGIDDLGRRPVKTILSGPAAGVSAALLHAGVSDGLFVEVGGTSTDISLIQGGNCSERSAEIGGVVLHQETLDVRTVGLAGGSMIRVLGGKLKGLGPRSAHIAGLNYLSFCPDARSVKCIEAELGGGTYLVLEDADGNRFAPTATCLANLAGWIPEGDNAHATHANLAEALAPVADKLGVTVEKLPETCFKPAAVPVLVVIRRMLDDYEARNRPLMIIAGGGGGSVIAPYLARELKIPCETAPDAEVISAIGAALAMLCETREKSVISPTDEDYREIAREVRETLIARGCAPESIETRVSFDPQRNHLEARATAPFGATVGEGESFSDEEILSRASRPFEGRVASAEIIEREGRFRVALVAEKKKGLFGLGAKSKAWTCVVDDAGRSHLTESGCALRRLEEDPLGEIGRLFDESVSYTDGGRELPDAWVVLPTKIVNLCSMPDKAGRLAILKEELEDSTGKALLVFRG